MLNDPFNEEHVDQLDDFILDNYVDEQKELVLDDGWADVHSEDGPVEVPVEEIVEITDDEPKELIVDDTVSGSEFISELVGNQDLGSAEDVNIDAIITAEMEDVKIKAPDKGYLSPNGPGIYIEGLDADYDDGYEQVLEDAKKQDKDYIEPKIDPPPNFRIRAQRSPRRYRSPRYDNQSRIMNGGYIRNNNHYKR